MKTDDQLTRHTRGADNGLETPAAARFICKAEVLRRVGVSYPTLWQWMIDQKFPRSRELGGKAAWLESDVENWILTRPLRRLKGDP